MTALYSVSAGENVLSPRPTRLPRHPNPYRDNNPWV